MLNSWPWNNMTCLDASLNIQGQNLNSWTVCYLQWMPYSTARILHFRPRQSNIILLQTYIFLLLLSKITIVGKAIEFFTFDIHIIFHKSYRIVILPFRTPQAAIISLVFLDSLSTALGFNSHLDIIALCNGDNLSCYVGNIHQCLLI